MEEGVPKRNYRGALCSAINCSNTKKTCPNKSFFRFPKAPERCRKWVVNCRRADLIERTPEYLYINCRICSDHFEECMFLDSVKNRLKGNATPTLFNISNALPSIYRKRLKNSYEFTVVRSKKRRKVEVERRNIDVSDEPDHSFHDHHVKSENEHIEESITQELFAIQAENDGIIFSQLGAEEEDARKNALQRPNYTKTQQGIWSPKGKLQNGLPKVTYEHMRTRHPKSKCSFITEICKTFTTDPCLLFESDGIERSKVNGQHYSPEMKQFFQSIYCHSPQCYRFLSRHFTMPSKTALKSWSKNQIMHPGDFSICINSLKEKIGKQNLKKICSISFGEITLKPKLFYDSKRDEIIGFEDYGSVKKPKIANSALVFWARGIVFNWKAPLGYIFTSGSCNYNYLRTLLFAILEKMEQAGFDVRLLICTQGGTFRRLIQKLGITENNPSFQHCGKSYHFMYDVHHLLKSIRNSLLKYTAKFNTFVASWTDILQVYEKDTLQEFRFLPKITQHHVRPNAVEKMKVKLAAQVLSHSMAVSIEAYIANNLLPSAAIGTAKFCAIFDKAIRWLNCSSFMSFSMNCSALSPKAEHMKFFKDFISFLNNLKFSEGTNDVTNRVKCIAGWIISVRSLICLWSDLKDQCIAKCIKTRYLNQDSLENFFSIIRQRDSFKFKPTLDQFVRAISQVTKNEVLKYASHHCVNCDSNGNTAEFGNDLTHCSRNSRLTMIFNNKCELKGVKYEKLDLYYLAVFLIEKMQKKHYCEMCQTLAKNYEAEYFLSDHQYATFNAQESPNRTRYTVPSQIFLNYLQKLNYVFSEMFPKSVCKPLVMENMLLEIQKIEPPMACFPKIYICILFLQVRIYHVLKWNNKKIREHIKTKNVAIQMNSL